MIRLIAFFWAMYIDVRIFYERLKLRWQLKRRERLKKREKERRKKENEGGKTR